MSGFGINVMDFGAKGDGVTDDTAAIQSAIDAVAAQGGGKIIIPYSPKGYRIARPAKEFVDGRPCRGQLVIPPKKGLNIAFEGEMPCKLLYSYQVRPMGAVKNNYTPTRFGNMGMPNTPCNVEIGSINYESGRHHLPLVSRLVTAVSDPENRFRGYLKWHQPWGDGEFPVVGAKNLKITKFGE